MTLRESFYQTLYKNDLIYTEKCSDEEIKGFSGKPSNSLPDDVYVIDGTYKRYKVGELSNDELQLLVLSKINNNLKIIKGCVIFFVIVAVIGIILGIVGLSQISSALHSAYSTTSSFLG